MKNESNVLTENQIRARIYANKGSVQNFIDHLDELYIHLPYEELANSQVIDELRKVKKHISHATMALRRALIILKRD